ncbi:hypothetical protein D3C71_1585880 [compost metagenome]
MSFAALQVVDDAGPEARLIGPARCCAWQRQFQRVAQLHQQVERLIVAHIQPIPRPGQGRIAQAERILRQQVALPVTDRRADQAQQHIAVGRVVQAFKQCRSRQAHGRQLWRTELVALGGGLLHQRSVEEGARGA